MKEIDNKDVQDSDNPISSIPTPGIGNKAYKLLYSSNFDALFGSVRILGRGFQLQILINMANSDNDT
jgi:hypothetical protein